VASNGLLSCAKGAAEDLELDAAGQQKLLNDAQTGILFVSHLTEGKLIYLISSIAQNTSQNC
jgi:hypothetical protein